MPEKAQECPLKHYLLQRFHVSNDEMEVGDPGSDSDFEIDTKKEVRQYGAQPNYSMCV